MSNNLEGNNQLELNKIGEGEPNPNGEWQNRTSGTKMLADTNSPWKKGR